MTLFGVIAHVFSKAGERCPWGEISTFLGATPSREQTMREQHAVSGRSLRAWTVYCRSVFVTGPRLNEHSVHASMTRQQSASDCETIRIPDDRGWRRRRDCGVLRHCVNVNSAGWQVTLRSHMACELPWRRG